MACNRRPPARSGAARGFVLAVTLWLLAGIAIVVALVTLWSLEQVQDAGRDRAQVEGQLAMLGTRDTLVYLAATRDMTLAGLPVEPLAEDQAAMRVLDEFGAMRRDPIGGELELDDRAYAGPGGTSFSLQDEAGLVTLAWPSARDLDRLLESLDIGDRQAPRMRDALLDYIDMDTLRHLHGAEEREYEREDLPPPPNRRLLVPVELGRVMGWRDLPPERLEAIAANATTFYAGAMNLNTVPPALLPYVMSGCPRNCTIFRDRRAERPFRDAYEVEALLGIELPGDDLVDYRFAPSDTLRLTLWGPSGAAWRIHVRLTPLADQRAPWVVLASYSTARPRLNDPPRPIENALFADTTTDRR